MKILYFVCNIAVRTHVAEARTLCVTKRAPLMTGYRRCIIAQGGLWRLPNQLISKSHFYLPRVTTSFSPFIREPIKVFVLKRGIALVDRLSHLDEGLNCG